VYRDKGTLRLNDSSDPPQNLTVMLYAQSNFTAQYQTFQGVDLQYGNCSISFSDNYSLVYNMTWDAVNSVFTYNRSFDSGGDFVWNVTCGAQYYPLISASNNITVYAYHNLSIEKVIDIVADDRYNISYYVWNFAAFKEKNLKVYDLLPAEFVTDYGSMAPNQSIYFSGFYTGNASVWDVDVLAESGYSFNYYLNGTGDHSTSFLYLMALDPILQPSTG